MQEFTICRSVTHILSGGLATMTYVPTLIRIFAKTNSICIRSIAQMKESWVYASNIFIVTEQNIATAKSGTETCLQTSIPCTIERMH